MRNVAFILLSFLLVSPTFAQISDRRERSGEVLTPPPGSLPPAPLPPDSPDRFGRTTEIPAPIVGIHPILVFGDEVPSTLKYKVVAALDLFQQYNPYFTQTQKTTFGLLQTINVSAYTTSFADVYNATFNISASYVNQSSIPWLASAIAHDTYHIKQYLSNPYAWPYRVPLVIELEACQFQLEVGRIIGLSSADQQRLTAWINGTEPYPLFQ